MPGGGVQGMSGTSMAAPHIAGLGAYILALEGNRTTADRVCDKIKELASRGAITNAGYGSTTLLAYNGSGK